MSKRDAAPTVGWVIASRFYKLLAIVLLLALLVAASGAYAVYRQLKTDCNDVFQRDLKASSYWIHFEVGSTHSECLQHASR